MAINMKKRKLNDFKTPIKIYRGCMGSGKTYSTLKEMNPEKQTVFLTERKNLVKDAAQITNHLVYPKDNANKSEQFYQLLTEGKSCSITHELFRRLDSKVIALIKELEIDCILDELLESTIKIRGTNSNTCCNPDEYISPGVRQILASIDVLDIDEKTGLVRWDAMKFMPPAGGGMIEDVYHWANNGVLHWFPTDDDDLSGFVVTAFPVRILEAFKSVSILCYGFEGLPLEGYMKLFDIPYVFDDRFLDNEEIDLHTLHSKIKIVEDCNVYDYLDKEAGKLKKKNGFSMSKTCWDTLITNETAKGIGSRIETYMRKNGFNQKDALWTTYDGHRDRVSKGFTRKVLNNAYDKNIDKKRKGTVKTFGSWNMKGTNEYKDRKLMIHLCCPHINENLRQFFLSRGIKLDNDAYTLEMTRQWIMRGIARDRTSEEIMTCLIGSKKARKLLNDWLNNRTSLKLVA